MCMQPRLHHCLLRSNAAETKLQKCYFISLQHVSAGECVDIFDEIQTQTQQTNKLNSISIIRFYRDNILLTVAMYFISVI